MILIFSFLPLEQELTSFKKNKHIPPLVYLSYDLTQHDGGAAMLPSKCTTCSVSVLRLMTESTALWKVAVAEKQCQEMGMLDPQSSCRVPRFRSLLEVWGGGGN